MAPVTLALRRSRLRVSKEELVVDNGVVAALHPLAAEAGARVLLSGGNAVDAAFATAFVLGVVEPFMSGPCGHGALAVHLAGPRTTAVVDFTTRAPRAAHAAMYELLPEQGRRGPLDWIAVKDEANDYGARSVPIPAAAQGLFTALERYGTRSAEELLQPAIALAEGGFAVDWYVSMLISASMRTLTRFPEAARTYLLEGRRPPAPPLGAGAGERLVQPQLGATLRTLGREGRAAIEQGELGRRIASAVQAAGGVLAAEDLEGYAPTVIEEGPALRYRQYRIPIVPGPSGHPTLAQLLGTLEALGAPPEDLDSADAYHLLAEVMRQAFLDRLEYLGDPTAGGVPLDAFFSAEYAREVASRIDPRRARLEARPGELWAHAGGGPGSPAGAVPDRASTTHFAVVDRDRNAVSCTVTLGLPFGSHFVVPDTGLLLLNNLHQFNPQPGLRNSVAPGRQPVWNGTPVIALDEQRRAVFAGGSTGARQIQSIVLQLLLGVLDHRLGPQQAIARPWIHCDGSATVVDGQLPGEVRAALAERGHQLVVQERGPSTVALGRPAAVEIDHRAGVLRAGVDVLGVGACVGY